MEEMTGFDYICSSIEIFEQSLESADGVRIIKTVAQLAKRTGYSVYHFTRLFFAVTGVYPKEYLSGRILSVAAKEIAETDSPLYSIALKFGFSDYESFSRAFRRRFGIPPRRVRELRSIPFDCVARVIPKIEGDALCLAPRRPELGRLDAHSLTGLSFYIEEGTVSFHRQWATFMKAQSLIKRRVLPEVFCQFSSWLDGGEVSGLSVLCAVQTESDIPQEAFFMSRNVPEATYVRFLHTSDVANLRATYQYIYKSWFASRETVPAASWEFQRYVDGGRTVEIYIPVALRQ